MNKMGFGFMRLPKVEGAGPDAPNGGYDFELGNAMADAFLAAGGTHFDTAYTYLDGESERGLRECVVKRHPRGSFTLSDKLPGYQCRSYEDCQKYFDESLERCGVDYFDVYFLHWLNGKNYNIAEKHDEFRFLRELKEQGKAKRIGFSYHDSPELLDRILTAHPEVDVVLIQINYLDWEAAGIESKGCYETCVKHGKSVFVMEPNKGGTLINLPEDAKAMLAEMHPDWSPARWALSFVQSLPAVEVCLSGMTNTDEVADNMSQTEPLTGEETALLAQVAALIKAKTAVECTACQYCVKHCPMNIAIPDYFKMYNEITRYPQEDWKIKPVYAQTALSRGKASACIGCGACASHCPQHLPIPELMPKVAGALE